MAWSWTDIYFLKHNTQILKFKSAWEFWSSVKLVSKLDFLESLETAAVFEKQIVVLKTIPLTISQGNYMAAACVRFRRFSIYKPFFNF